MSEREYTVKVKDYPWGGFISDSIGQYVYRLIENPWHTIYETALWIIGGTIIFVMLLVAAAAS